MSQAVKRLAGSNPALTDLNKMFEFPNLQISKTILKLGNSQIVW